MTSKKISMNFLIAGIIIALVMLLAVIITLSVFNWNADIKKAIIWSGLITVGSLLATLYPIWMSLKAEKGQDHLNTFIVYQKPGGDKVEPLVKDIMSKRFHDYQLAWEAQKPNALPDSSEKSQSNFYAEALIVNVLQALKNYGAMGKNGMVETDPSLQEHIFGARLEPTTVHTTVKIEKDKIATNYLNDQNLANLIANGIELPKGTSVKLGSENYNEHFNFPTLTLEKKNYFTLYIRLTPGFSPADQKYKNGDGKSIDARCISFSLDCFWELPEISAKNAHREEYKKWIEDVLKLLKERFYDKELRYIP